MVLDKGAQESGAINSAAWSEYVTQGREHFDRVVRSFNVFMMNAHELRGLLSGVETDVVASMTLTGDPHPDDPEAAKFRAAFWAHLDQRLHNMVSAALTLVDHTRPLVKFYSREDDFISSWKSKNAAVALSQEARFLRKLRNYLIHVGVAPLMHTIMLGPPAPAEDWDNLIIQLSPSGLLRWDKWNASERAYIRAFKDGGMPIRSIVTKYVQDMDGLYRWLFEQYDVLHVAGVPPTHLYKCACPPTPLDAKHHPHGPILLAGHCAAMPTPFAPR